MRANPRRAQGLCLGLLLVGSAGAAEAGQAASPACHVSASFEPARAVVGQQVLWRARISRRSDVRAVAWERAPNFPGLRAEWLPGRVEDTRSGSGDATFHQREEHRALFAARAGTFVIPSVALLCEVAGAPGRAAHTERVPLAAGELIVDELPDAGRPARFRGLVGPLTVQAHADRTRIELGESVRVSVMLLGAANLWDAAPPLQEVDLLGGVEIFRAPPTLDLQPGGKLYVRRAFRLDVVPRSLQPLIIPELRVAYYDPLERRYEVAVAPAIRVDVLPRGALREPDSDSKVSPEPRARKPEEVVDRSPLWSFAIALGIGLAAVGLTRRHFARRGLAELDAALVSARAAGQRGDARAEAAGYARALRAALAVAAPGTQQLDAEALRAHAEALASERPELLQAASLLADLDRCRYAPEAGRPAAEAANAMIAKLRSLPPGSRTGEPAARRARLPGVIRRLR